MDARTYWSVIGVTLLVTVVVQFVPGLQRRYLTGCAAWVFCALYLYARADDWAVVVVPVACVVGLTVLKLVTPD